jgi:signal transduction histidine kinase/ActR/RegA family two-component response regulator
VEPEVKSRAVLYVGPQCDLRAQIAQEVEASERDLAWDYCEHTSDMAAKLSGRDYEAFIFDARIEDPASLIQIMQRSQERSAAPRIVVYSNAKDAANRFKAYRNSQTYLLDETRVDRFSVILERALDHRHLAKRLQAISEIARAIAATFDIDQIFEILGTKLQSIVEFRRLSLRVLDSESKTFESWDVKQIGRKQKPEFQKGIELGTAEHKLLHRVLASEELTVVSDKIPQCMQMAGVRAYALIPLLGSQESKGVFSVGFFKTPIEVETLEILEDLAVHMCIALQNAQAYRQLEEAQNQLFRSEKLQVLGELAAGVAHDFNNLLSAILGRAQMLKVNLEDQEILRSIEIIEEAALDGARTVARIQEYAKASTDTDFAPIEVDLAVQQTVDRAQGSLRTRGRNDLDVQLDLQSKATVLGNLSELRQVLTNLIFNAVDAMENGGRLTVSSGTDKEGKRVWFSVTDQGVGMDAQHQAKIFNPFFSTKGQKGTGLGLSVSSNIIERHGGEFIVDSKVGRGTNVKVCLPCFEGDAAAEAIIDPRKSWRPTPVPPPETLVKTRAKILVIDDDEAVLDVLSEILRTGQHIVFGARRGVEGLKLFKKHDFDLVFTDLGMPDMNGFEVASEIRALDSQIPIGLITGWGASLDEGRMKDSGVDLIVSKPFRYHEVLDLVTEAMTYKRGQES